MAESTEARAAVGLLLVHGNPRAVAAANVLVVAGGRRLAPTYVGIEEDR